MTLLDPLLLVVLAVSVAAGWRIGFLVRAAGLGGFVVGLALSLGLVPIITRQIDPQTVGAALSVTAFTVVLTVLASMIALQMWAWRLRAQLSDLRAQTLDRLGGAAVGALGAVVFVWFTAPLAAMIPGETARQVRESVVVSTVNDLSPSGANPLAALQTLLADSRFPEVFTDLVAVQASDVPPARLPVSQTVVDAGTASTVKIEVVGCGTSYVGSGWVVRRDLVVTNAHVVAGAEQLTVRRPDGSRAEGTVVTFDDDRDLALVGVPGLGLPALPTADTTPGRPAATFGHPRGQEQLRVAPARVDRAISATGRDIYGQDETRRSILVLAASLARGDSGSAVLDADGAVVGTVFAISPSNRDTAYALATSELREVLAAPRSAGDAGRCS